jgi:signal transduction histidine kinase
MVDVKEAFGRALDKFNGGLSDRGFTILNQIPAGLPHLMVEREKFQCLLDLLLKEDVVSLSSEKKIVFSAHHRLGDEEVVEIEVSARGPGLPRDALRAVFDPFYSRPQTQQSFGINLMACYFIVYHHGGRIELRSEEGQGLTLRLIFPMQPKLNSPVEQEEAFLQRVLVNDAFWERVIAARE